MNNWKQALEKTLVEFKVNRIARIEIIKIITIIITIIIIIVIIITKDFIAKDWNLIC